MKTTQLIFTVILFCALLSCSKKEEVLQLPTGENTAYYYLNSNLVIPKGTSGVPPIVKPLRFGMCTTPTIGFALNLNNSSETLELFVKDATVNISSYQLNNGISDIQICNNINSFAMMRTYENSNQNTLYVTSQNSGEVVITKLSPNKRQFSGTFKATLKSANGQIVEITGGVFDINLDTL